MKIIWGFLDGKMMGKIFLQGEVRIQSEYRTQCYPLIFLNGVTRSNFLHLYNYTRRCFHTLLQI